MNDATPRYSTGTEELIEAEAKRRCLETGYTLEFLACQDRRFLHDDRRPWWQAMYCHGIKAEIKRLEKAGFVVSPRSGDAAQAASEPANGDVVTVKVPDGYDSVWDFLNDCGLESVPPQPVAIAYASGMPPGLPAGWTMEAAVKAAWMVNTLAITATDEWRSKNELLVEFRRLAFPSTDGGSAA